MKSHKPYHFFHYCLLVVALLMTTNLLILPTNYLVESGELEKEWSEWAEEIDALADYEFSDGNNDYYISTAYLKSSKLFSFLGENNSNTIPICIQTIAQALPSKLYLLFQHLKLDC